MSVSLSANWFKAQAVRSAHDCSSKFFCPGALETKGQRELAFFALRWKRLGGTSQQRQDGFPHQRVDRDALGASPLL